MITLRHLLVVGLLFVNTICSAMNMPLEDFSIRAYPQALSDYLPPDAPNYNTPLLSESYQKKQLERFFNHYYSSENDGLSPWSETFVKTIIPIVRVKQYENLASYKNAKLPENKRHYGENYKPHDEAWWNNFQQKVNFSALNSMGYKANQRAIAVNNTLARGLPDNAPDFFSPTIAGDGFPFDNLQDSAIWAGTPLYVFSESADKEWVLVLTPDLYFSWVQSRDIAYASAEFIAQWQSAIKNKAVAITKTAVSIFDSHQHFRLKGYIGAVFPGTKAQDTLLIPEKNADNQAVISEGHVDADAISVMPLAASKKNLSALLEQLQNRPYGWGGMFFYNDCSQELKSLFAPFGIWLPRNTSQQAKLGKNLNLAPLNIDQRLATLKSKGHPLMTLIYNGGHIMLYVGHQPLNGQNDVAITYQNVWGLRNPTQDKRYVIGQSLFFPLLKSYPEFADILPQAGFKDYFELVFLDELDDSLDSQIRLVKLLMQ